MAGIARLSGTVKHYDWGGTSFIPSLLDKQNTEGKPFAEYWLGVHPQANCLVEVAGQSQGSLREIIHASPAATLGDFVYHRFGNLPYLLKVLDVKDMLSIQVHPDKKDAERDFSDENKKGIPLDAPNRNYKDDNHKPELMAAMSEFWLLHGFKPKEKLSDTIQAVDELDFLLPIFEESGYVGLYRKVMEMPQNEVNVILQSLIDRIIPLYKAGKLAKSQEDFWAARAALNFLDGANIDRGIFSIYLFNLVQLQKGEAIFQDAGVPHAYLEGQNVEIMASSDNVLRGGLTTKHIDVKELMKHVKCEPTDVKVLKGDQRGIEVIYKTTAPDFELSAFELGTEARVSITATTAEILLLMQGNVEIKNNAETVDLKRGYPSAIIFPGTTAEVHAKEISLIFRASVPVDK